VGSQVAATGIRARHRLTEGGKLLELGWLVAILIATLDFNADREVVALLAAAKTRLTRVPGTIEARHILVDRPVSLYEKMGRHAQAFEPLETRVGSTVEASHEEVCHCLAAIGALGQADPMDHQKVD
jgi:hypothetical protein